MAKRIEFYPGDKIKTKKNIKVVLQDGSIRTEEDIYEGLVIDVRGDFILVDLNVEKDFTHYLDGLLLKPTGLAILKKDVKIVETYENEDKDLEKFVKEFKGVKIKSIKKTYVEIEGIKKEIRENNVYIRDSLTTLSNYEKRLLEKNFELKNKIESIDYSLTDVDRIEKQYLKSMKNKKIKSIKIVERNNRKYLLVTTNDLTYRNSNSNMKDYVLGAYKILICIDNYIKPIAINYKKHQEKFKYHHPCIANSNICMGSTVEMEIQKLINEGNYIEAIYLLISFLEEPNYSSPHTQDYVFYCAQDVTIKPKDELSWFDPNFWLDEEWDGAKFSKDYEKIQEELRNL